MRLDFDTFVISGPSTSTATGEAKISGGVLNTASGISATTASQCLTDRFQVTNSGGITPPVICGINTGEHSKIYLIFLH